MPLHTLANQPHKSPAEAAVNRTSPGKVTGRLLVALNAMVWQAQTRKQAAATADMTEHSLYVALRRPHVRQWYLAECEVLRTSEHARNIHRLVEIREAANNMPAVQAIDRLMRNNEEQQALSSIPRIGGLVIHIHNSGGSHMSHERATTANPLIEHDHASHDGQSDGD